MKNYTSPHSQIVQAFQYKNSPNKPEMVKLCRPGMNGEVKKVPSDLLSTPKDAFNGVETSQGWVKVSDGDWIISSEGEYSVIPHSTFIFLFKEI